MLSPLVPDPSQVQYQLAHTSDNRSSQILISHLICLPLATITIILRLVSRYLCKARRLQTDDYLIIAAWVLPSPPMSWVNSVFDIHCWSSDFMSGYWNKNLLWSLTRSFYRFLHRHRSSSDCYVSLLLPKLKISSRRSQRTRRPLWRRQTRNPREISTDIRKGVTCTIHLH